MDILVIHNYGDLKKDEREDIKLCLRAYLKFENMPKFAYGTMFIKNFDKIKPLAQEMIQDTIAGITVNFEIINSKDTNLF